MCLPPASGCGPASEVLMTPLLTLGLLGGSAAPGSGRSQGTRKTEPSNRLVNGFEGHWRVLFWEEVWEGVPCDAYFQVACPGFKKRLIGIAMYSPLSFSCSLTWARSAGAQGRGRGLVSLRAIHSSCSTQRRG